MKRLSVFYRPNIHERLLTPVQRWSYMRKIDLVVALRAKLVTLEEVKRAHGLTGEEIKAWQEAFDKGGAKALRLAAGPKARAA